MDQSKKMNNPPIPISSRKELSDALERDWQSPDCKLRKSIQGWLYRYKLTTYDVSEVLDEAVVRAINHIEKKELIPDLFGWLRNASYKIIQEEYRKKKYRKKTFKKLSNQDELIAKADVEKISSTDEDKEIDLVYKLVKSLPTLERAIIDLKSQGLSWEKICQELANKKLITLDELNSPKTLERIKRKGNRTIEKIKSLIQEASKVYK